MSTIAILQHNDLLQVVLMLDKLQEKIKASRARQWVLESCRVLLGCFAGTGQAPGRAVSNSPVGWSIEWNGNSAHRAFRFLTGPLEWQLAGFPAKVARPGWRKSLPPKKAMETPHVSDLPAFLCAFHGECCQATSGCRYERPAE